MPVPQLSAQFNAQKCAYSNVEGQTFSEGETLDPLKVHPRQKFWLHGWSDIIKQADALQRDYMKTTPTNLGAYFAPKTLKISARTTLPSVKFKLEFYENGYRYELGDLKSKHSSKPTNIHSQNLIFLRNVLHTISYGY